MSSFRNGSRLTLHSHPKGNDGQPNEVIPVHQARRTEAAASTPRTLADLRQQPPTTSLRAVGKPASEVRVPLDPPGVCLGVELESGALTMQEFSVSYPGRTVGPTVARTATVSRIPRTSVARVGDHESAMKAGRGRLRCRRDADQECCPACPAPAGPASARGRHTQCGYGEPGGGQSIGRH